MAEKLRGGKADNLSVSDIAKKTNSTVPKIKSVLKQGTKVEKEHTTDPKIAKEIAKDHTVESPKYYKELNKMEKKIEAKECVDASSSGSVESSLKKMPVIKRPKINTIHNFSPSAKQEEIDEVTDSSVSASGSYDAAFPGSGKNKLGIGGESSINQSRAVQDPKFPKLGGPEGKYIKIKDKCKKFPYCNQGIDAIEILKETIEEVAKKYNLPISEVENLVIKENKKMKNKELTDFVNKTINEEAKNILSEQYLNKPDNSTENISSDNSNEYTDKFKSLAGLSFDTNQIEKITDGMVFNIENVNPEEFMSVYNASSIEEAQSNMISAINKDIDEIEGEDYDVDVDIETDDETLKLKITLYKAEPLSDDENQNINEKVKECKECNQNMKENKKVVALSEDKLIDLIAKMVLTEEPKQTKKTIRLTESQLNKVIQHVMESVPGLQAVEKAHKTTGSDTTTHAKEVEKKLKKYLSFEDNDNPEFPHQIDGEKKAYRNSEDEEDYINDYRGGGMQDLKYDNEPSDEFKERQEKAIEGDSSMGNETKDVGNVINTDLGKNVIKRAKKKAKDNADDPMYVKDAQPVDDDEEKAKIKLAMNESVADEIAKMKHMYSFNKSLK